IRTVLNEMTRSRTTAVAPWTRPRKPLLRRESRSRGLFSPPRVSGTCTFPPSPGLRSRFRRASAKPRRAIVCDGADVSVAGPPLALSDGSDVAVSRRGAKGERGHGQPGAVRRGRRTDQGQGPAGSAGDGADGHGGAQR